MKPRRLANPDVLLIILLLTGAAFTVFGGMRLLADAGDVNAVNAFGIGLGMLFPLLAILGLRLFSPTPRND